MIYGYCRISRKTQNIDRQIRNIIAEFPQAELFREAFTGRKFAGRKEFEKLLSQVKPGDTIVFDSVSRMSRNAQEGIELYFELFDKGVELVFLNERYIDTSIYRESVNQTISTTGNEIADIYIEATNQVIKILAKKQIEKAFEQAQKEVDDLSVRTSQGIKTAKNNGKQVGQRKGAVLNIKKKEPLKCEILKKSKDFEGYMSDKDLMKVLGIARNTYYKYKKELANEDK